jgi:heme-degrading monooxygenase HmoA
MEQIFIDHFIVPQPAKTEFLERMAVNRNFIKDLPGFIGDQAYERRDDDGSFRYITIAVWTSEEALRHAKALVQTEYQREGFDLRAMLERLEIRMERELYSPLG